MSTPRAAHMTVTLGSAQFGLSLFNLLDLTATDPKRTRVAKASGNPVGESLYDKITGAVLTAEDVHLVKMAGDQMVPIDESVLALVSGMESGTAKVLGFHPLDQISNFIVVGRYAVRAWNGNAERPLAGSAKVWASIEYGMDTEEVFALIEWCSRGKTRYGALFSDGSMEALAYAEEVRQEPKPSKPLALSEEEKALGIDAVSLFTDNAAEVREHKALANMEDYLEMAGKGQMPAPAEAAPPIGHAFTAFKTLVSTAKEKSGSITA